MQFRSTRQVELLGDFEVCNMIRSTSVQVKCVSLFEEVRRRITRANLCVCVCGDGVSQNVHLPQGLLLTATTPV